MATARSKAHILHPLVFAVEMLFGVGDQLDETVYQLVFGRQLGGGQQVNKLAVRLVHFVHVHHQVVRPGERGLFV